VAAPYERVRHSCCCCCCCCCWCEAIVQKRATPGPCPFGMPCYQRAAAGILMKPSRQHPTNHAAHKQCLELKGPHQHNISAAPEMPHINAAQSTFVSPDATTGGALHQFLLTDVLFPICLHCTNPVCCIAACDVQCTSCGVYTILHTWYCDGLMEDAATHTE
jgi:hypothetical protein